MHKVSYQCISFVMFRKNCKEKLITNNALLSITRKLTNMSDNFTGKLESLVEGQKQSITLITNQLQKIDQRLFNIESQLKEKIREKEHVPKELSVRTFIEYFFAWQSARRVSYAGQTHLTKRCFHSRLK